MTCFFGEISFTLNKHSRFEFWKRVKGDKVMKKRISFICFLPIVLLLAGCPFTTGKPFLVSIDFIDNKTIEYKVATSLDYEYDQSFSASLVSVTPDDGYRIKMNTFSLNKGQIFFNKDIPDGVQLELDFYDGDRNYVFSHTIVKGETSEE